MASYGNTEFFQVLRLAAEGECSVHHRMMQEYSALVATSPFAPAAKPGVFRMAKSVKYPACSGYRPEGRLSGSQQATGLGVRQNSPGRYRRCWSGSVVVVDGPARLCYTAGAMRGGLGWK